MAEKAAFVGKLRKQTHWATLLFSLCPNRFPSLHDSLSKTVRQFSSYPLLSRSDPAPNHLPSPYGKPLHPPRHSHAIAYIHRQGAGRAHSDPRDQIPQIVRGCVQSQTELSRKGSRGSQLRALSVSSTWAHIPAFPPLGSHSHCPPQTHTHGCGKGKRPDLASRLGL